jgi:shikimate kinase
MNQARPLLLGNVRGTLATLLEQREPVYAQVSTHVIDTSGRTVGQVADEVVRIVRAGEGTHD